MLANHKVRGSILSESVHSFYSNTKLYVYIMFYYCILD